MSENVESKDLSRTFSVANFKAAAATPETVDEVRISFFFFFRKGFFFKFWLFTPPSLSRIGFLWK